MASQTTLNPANGARPAPPSPGAPGDGLLDGQRGTPAPAPTMSRDEDYLVEDHLNLLSSQGPRSSCYPRNGSSFLNGSSRMNGSVLSNLNNSSLPYSAHPDLSYYSAHTDLKQLGESTSSERFERMLLEQQFFEEWGEDSVATVSIAGARPPPSGGGSGKKWGGLKTTGAQGGAAAQLTSSSVRTPKNDDYRRNSTAGGQVAGPALAENRTAASEAGGLVSPAPSAGYDLWSRTTPGYSDAWSRDQTPLSVQSEQLTAMMERQSQLSRDLEAKKRELKLRQESRGRGGTGTTPGPR